MKNNTQNLIYDLNRELEKLEKSLRKINNFKDLELEMEKINSLIRDIKLDKNIEVGRFNIFLQIKLKNQKKQTMKQTLNTILDILILTLLVYFISKIFGLDIFKELFISNFVGYGIIRFVDIIKESFK